MNGVDDQSRSREPPVPRRGPHGRPLPFVLVYLVFLFVLFEGSLRAYLVWKQGASFFEPRRMIFKQYPQLEPIFDQNTGPGRASFDVLLLGGSVLHPEYGTIAQRLQEELRRSLGPEVRMFNLADIAHTTRDSVFKYERLAGQRFEQVVVYHGINDVRANNCPPEYFSAEYLHYSWYELLEVARRHRAWIDVTVIPYAFDYLFHRLKQWQWAERYVPAEKPRPEWLKYGEQIKTRASFRMNLRLIEQAARERGDPLLLMSFAHYVPPNYSMPAFTNQALDYVDHDIPIELWGKPAHVVKGMRVHNEVIRELAQTSPGALFVDMDRRIPP